MSLPNQTLQVMIVMVLFWNVPTLHTRLGFAQEQKPVSVNQIETMIGSEENVRLHLARLQE